MKNDISVRMVPVVVGIDGIQNRFIRYPPNSMKHPTRHTLVNLRINDSNPFVTNNDGRINDIAKKVNSICYLFKRAVLKRSVRVVLGRLHVVSPNEIASLLNQIIQIVLIPVTGTIKPTTDTDSHPRIIAIEEKQHNDPDTGFCTDYSDIICSTCGL